jgi:hypothetical protein
MFVQNLDKIMVSVITKPSIMKNIKEKNYFFTIMYTLRKFSTYLCWMIELENILAFSFACKIKFSNLQVNYK